MGFLKVWAKHNFYYKRYISVYIQPRYFYLIFRSVNGNNVSGYFALCQAILLKEAGFFPRI